MKQIKSLQINDVKIALNKIATDYLVTSRNSKRWLKCLECDTREQAEQAYHAMHNVELMELVNKL